MDFKVVLTESFFNDLHAIIASIAEKNPTAAGRLGEKIITKAEALSSFPDRHPRLRKRQSIRRFIAGKHFKVFYRINTDSRTVTVLRCRDGRRESDPFLG